jgi:hypothetical protein
MKHAVDKHEIDTKYYLEDHKERAHMSYLSIDRVVILNWVLEKLVVKMETGLS